MAFAQIIDFDGTLENPVDCNVEYNFELSPTPNWRIPPYEFSTPVPCCMQRCVLDFNIIEYNSELKNKVIHYIDILYVLGHTQKLKKSDVCFNIKLYIPSSHMYVDLKDCQITSSANHMKFVVSCDHYYVTLENNTEDMLYNNDLMNIKYDSDNILETKQSDVVKTEEKIDLNNNLETIHVDNDEAEKNMDELLI